MKAIIIGGGEFNSIDLLMEKAKKADLIICADGGAEYVKDIGIIPDFILGDMDSIKEEVLNYFSEKGVFMERWPTIKNFTDMEIAIEFAIEKGVKKIALLGAIGNRLDHSFINQLMLIKYFDEGILIKIYNDNNIVQPLRSMKITKKYKYLSVIALDKKINISLKGVTYPLDKTTIDRASSLGISNEIIEEAEIILHSGSGLLIESN